MKTRIGFVSNSSSSSFIMKFRDKMSFDQFLNGTMWRGPASFVPNMMSYVETCHPEIVHSIDKSDHFTLKEAIETFEGIVQRSKKGLTRDQIAEELSSGWLDSIDSVVDGYEKTILAKEAAKLGMTVEEFEKDFNRLNAIWKKKNAFRKKTAGYVAESLRHCDREYFVSFEIADENGAIHGFLEHHFCKEVFTFDPTIICISHH